MSLMVRYDPIYNCRQHEPLIYGLFLRSIECGYDDWDHGRH